MRLWILFSLVLIVVAASASLVVWAHREAWLPDKVPTHWGAGGQPDRFTSRDDLLPHLLALPAVMAGMLLLGLALPWMSPAHFKIEPFRDTYEFIMALVVALFGYMHAMVLMAYTQQIVAVDRWITAGSLLAIAALGNVLGKVKRNFWIGIRTPWTLASETVWVRTHRLGAWLFTAGGLVGFVLVLVGVHPVVALSVFGVAALVPVVYSLVLYKYLEKRGRVGEA